LKLRDVVTSLSSKNAGNFHLTYDIGFPDEATYERFRDGNILDARSVAAAFGMEKSEVVSVIAFDPGRVIKVNVRRQRASGDPGETDVFGAQQYAPLLDLEVPD
jgi:Domain of unknown function (DUF4387)